MGLLGGEREHTEIPHLTGKDDPSIGFMRVREKLLSEALRPSDSTGEWQVLNNQIDDEKKAAALAGISLIEAEGERQEALSIALALRETLEDETKTTALVTPDRNLARRVAVEMQRFGVFVDDSAGQPLKNRPVGTFTRLVLQQAFATADPVTLVSLLQHPLFLLGAKPERTRHAARLFEIVALRGAIVPPEAGEFHVLVSEKHHAVKQGKGRFHRSLKRLSEQDWIDVAWLSDALDTIFHSDKIDSDADLPLSDLVARTISILEQCAIDHDGGLSALYGHEDGRVLGDFLSELLQDGSGTQLDASQWPDVFDALISQKTTRPIGGTHPRVSILGPLEARLQTYDRIILGGLNEKSWPAAARNDPFLSRPMKNALGLPPPERRTGLAAHDFQVLLGNKDVVLTRSLKADNAPTVASRWVQRLMMIAGKDNCKAMETRGQRFVDWANLIDSPQSSPKAISQPRPAPPVEERPTKLSITEIETWISDPYAIYAKHVLRLRPLESLLRSADARERGTLYHKIMEEFVRFVPDPNCDDALEQLLELAQHNFNTSSVPPEHAVIWWARFQTIAKAFLQWHRSQFGKIKRSHVELYGNTNEDLNGFTLSGQIDRLDETNAGTIQVYDYKTGKYPSIGKVRSLKAPQLLLSAAMATRGAFGIEAGNGIDCLSYIRLRPEEELEVDTVEGEEACELAEDAWQELQALIEAYQNSSKAYWSKARPVSDNDFESDYDHLARVREWSTGEDGEDSK